METTTANAPAATAQTTGRPQDAMEPGEPQTRCDQLDHDDLTSPENLERAADLVECLAEGMPQTFSTYAYLTALANLFIASSRDVLEVDPRAAFEQIADIIEPLRAAHRSRSNGAAG